MNANLPIPTEFQEIATICAATEGMIGGRSCLVVDGRALHSGLQAGRVFRAWMPGRIDEYGFIDGQDFETHDNLSRPDPDTSKARPQKIKDYRLTLDMAKELSMVENNERGRLARRYFIWREQQALALQPSVSVAEIEQRMMSALGGMFKGILMKRVGERIDKLESSVQSLIISHDPRVAAITDQTAKEWLEEYKCIQTGRRGMVNVVGGALRTIALRQGLSLKRCRRTGTWLFPVEIARPYMDTIGKALIRKHNDQIVLGQRTLKLNEKQKRKAGAAPFAKRPEPAS